MTFPVFTSIGLNCVCVHNFVPFGRPYIDVKSIYITNIPHDEGIAASTEYNNDVYILASQGRTYRF